MKNAMQLKALVRNKAAKWGISAQLVLQNLMLERLLERVSQTRYREHFILKGGFLPMLPERRAGYAGRRRPAPRPIRSGRPHPGFPGAGCWGPPIPA